LIELPLPDAISYAPQTVGWIFVALIAIALAVLAVWAIWRRRRQQRYRRVALTELASIEALLATSQVNSEQRASALAAIPRLLKRTSLAVAPRKQVAEISPDEAAALIVHTRDWIEHHHVEV
jgi:type VI protein secretion system component VasK